MSASTRILRADPTATSLEKTRVQGVTASTWATPCAFVNDSPPGRDTLDKIGTPWRTFTTDHEGLLSLHPQGRIRLRPWASAPQESGLGHPSIAYVHHVRQRSTRGYAWRTTRANRLMQDWILWSVASAPCIAKSSSRETHGGAEEEECQDQYFPAPPVLGISPCNEEFCRNSSILEVIQRFSTHRALLSHTLYHRKIFIKGALSDSPPVRDPPSPLIPGCGGGGHKRISDMDAGSGFVYTTKMRTFRYDDCVRASTRRNLLKSDSSSKSTMRELSSSGSIERWSRGDTKARLYCCCDKRDMK